MFTYFQEEVKTSQYCKSYAQVVATGGRCLQQQVSSQPCEVIVICDNNIQQDVVGPSTQEEVTSFNQESCSDSEVNN